ncbi:MAG TPA: C39 family peptidase [Candidatus Dormibacteraeota bacterium]
MKRGLLRLGASCLVVLSMLATNGLSAVASQSVPTISQRNGAWSRDALGSDPIDTIGSSGCALTAVAMVSSAFGQQTSPAALNQWLTTHGGYIQNDLLLWRQATASTHGAVRWRWLHVPGISPQLRTDDQNIEDLPPASLVESELDAGNLVVAEVRLQGGMHFVVLTGHTGDTFYINDPWFGDRTTLQARYGSYGQAVHSAQVYTRS